MNEWISVKDRLPDEAGEYLVTIHGEDDVNACDFVLLAWYNPLPSLLFSSDVGWSLLNEFYPFTERLRERITHWMPLPEPPKGESDG